MENDSDYGWRCTTCGNPNDGPGYEGLCAECYERVYQSSSVDPQLLALVETEMALAKVIDEFGIIPSPISNALEDHWHTLQIYVCTRVNEGEDITPYEGYGFTEIDCAELLESLRVDEDIDDSFPMSLEYETPGNAGDFHVEQEAQDFPF